MIHAAGVTVRDSESERRLDLTSNGATSTVVDPVFALGRLFPELREANDPIIRLIHSRLGARYVMAHVSPGYAAGRLGEWCEAISEISRITGLPIALTPVCDFLGDEIVLKWVEDSLKQTGTRCMVVPGRRNVKTTAAIIAQSNAVVTSSLHAAVTAASFGIALAVLAPHSSHKHRGTLATVGLSGCVTADIEALPNRIKDALSMDTSHSADEGAEMAMRDLNQMISVMCSSTSTSPDPQLLVRSAEKLILQERQVAVSNKPMMIRRLVANVMRKVPPVNRFYREHRIKSLLP